MSAHRGPVPFARVAAWALLVLLAGNTTLYVAVRLQGPLTEGEAVPFLVAQFIGLVAFLGFLVRAGRRRAS